MSMRKRRKLQNRHRAPVRRRIDPGLPPLVHEDLFFRKLMEEERCFLNPEEWGIDLRPVFKERLDPPASPDDLSDAEVRSILGEMVLLLAQHHCCLTSTDHLTDRQLYRYIIGNILPHPVGVSPDPSGCLLTIECCPCDSDDYLRYYADDLMREELRALHDSEPPAKAPLAADRDSWLQALAEAHRHLPIPGYESGC